MTADPITTWLGGPDTGEPPQEEPPAKVMGSAEVPVFLRVGNQDERNVGTVTRPDDDAELAPRVAALLREVADEIEHSETIRAH